MDEPVSTVETPPPATPAPAPATPTPAPTETPAPVAPAAPLSRRDKLAQAFAKPPDQRGRHAAFQPRQDAGKFAPGAPQVPPLPAVPPIPRPEMPQTFKKELKPHWDAAPVELAAAIHQRELDARKGVELLQSKAQQADELLNEFKPYEWLLKNENATPKAAIAPLLQTAAIFRTGTPLQKVQQVVGIMQTYGVPLEHVQQMLSGNGSQPAPDPQYNQLAQQVNELKQNWTQTLQQQQQQSEARALSVIERFAADATHPHFEAVQDRMLQLLQAPQVMGDTTMMNEQEKLQLAYDTAIRLDPALTAQVAAAQQAATQTPTQVTRAKAAAVQVKGAPASGPAPAVNPKDRRAVIANAFRQA